MKLLALGYIWFQRHLKKYDVAYEVYRGGLTTMLNDIQERFEFLVDAKTGTVLEVITA